jgi:hypothetical protein
VGTQGFFLHAFNLAGLAVLVFVTIRKLPALAARLVSGTWFQSAAEIDFFTPGAPSAPPAYVGSSGDGGGAGRSAYREEVAAIQSSQYEGIGSYLRNQESSRPSSIVSSGESYGREGGLSAVPPGAAYSRSAEPSPGQDDVPAESSFLETSIAGRGSAGAVSPAESGLLQSPAANVAGAIGNRAVVSQTGSEGAGATGAAAEDRAGKDLRSVAFDSLVAVEVEKYGGGDKTGERIQKRFPTTEMSPLQIEILKGMAE